MSSDPDPSKAGNRMQLPRNGKILFFAPHPDDEALAAGAILQQLKQLENEIHIIYLTSGSDRSMQEVREKEARKSCEKIDADAIFKRFRIIQGEPESLFNKKNEEHVKELVDVIRYYSPDIVFIPSKADPHYAHSYSFKITHSALNRSLYTGTILEYSIWSTISVPNALFSFNEHSMELKMELLKIYESQLNILPFHLAIMGLNRYHGIMSSQNKHMVSQHNDGGDASDRSHEADDIDIDHSMTFLESPDIDPRTQNEYAEHFKLIPSVPAGGVMSVGDVFLDILPEPVDLDFLEGSSSTTFTMTPGGNAANFAIALSRFGMISSMYVCIGDDPRGQIIQRELNKFDVHPYIEYKNTTTATTYALSLRDGTRHFYSDFGSNLSFEPIDLPQLHRGFKHLHRAGFFWIPGWINGSNEQLLIQAKSQGMTTSMDVGTPPNNIYQNEENAVEDQGSDLDHFGYWTLEHRNEISGLMQHLDIFFANELEIKGVTQSLNIENGANILLSKGVRFVVVHQGEMGGTIFSENGVYSSKATKVVSENPTGAGDIFNAAFIYEFLQGNNIKQCLDFAVAAGTFHVSCRKNPYPKRSEVLNFMEVQRREQEYL